MAREPKERIHGPYQHRSRWRIVGVRADGTRVRASYATREEALEALKEARQALGTRTWGTTVTDYLDHLRLKGRKPSTLKVNHYRLMAFLRLVDEDHPLEAMTPGKAAELYAARVQETKANTHHAELALAKAWAGWCVKQGWLAANPFDDVEPVGVKAAGGDVLRVNEARRLLACALADNFGGATPSKPGLAVALALITGARVGEIMTRTVRDVDDDARLLWVTEAKTRAGVRQLAIPDEPAALRLGLLGLCSGRDPTELLFDAKGGRQWMTRHLARLCKAAGVPVVSPHDLRRTHATLARRSGVAAEAVARELGHSGHAGTGTLHRHYLEPGTDESVTAATVASQLAPTLPTPLVPHNASNPGDNAHVTATRPHGTGEHGEASEFPSTPQPDSSGLN